MSRCDEIRERLSAYLDGELPPPEAALVVEHLESCPGCREELDDLRRLRDQVARHLAPPAVDDEEWGEMASNAVARGARRLGWLLVVPAVLVLLGGGLGTFFLDPGIPAWVRAGIGALVGGLASLFVSALADRLAARRHERYEEVER